MQESEQKTAEVAQPDVGEALLAAVAEAVQEKTENPLPERGEKEKSLLGKRMQTLIQNRKAGKNGKLPYNYNGLGSTAALEELERFRNQTLNSELQGARGQRKEIYLAWLAKKEQRRNEEKTSKKLADKEKAKEQRAEIEEKKKERELAWKAWQERKKELAKKQKRENRVRKTHYRTISYRREPSGY